MTTGKNWPPDQADPRKRHDVLYWVLAGMLLLIAAVAIGLALFAPSHTSRPPTGSRIGRIAVDAGHHAAEVGVQVGILLAPTPTPTPGVPHVLDGMGGQH